MREVIYFSGMHHSQAVDDFVRHAAEMLRALRSQGHELSDLDLHKLTTHLHLLEIESTNLQTLRKLQPMNRAA